MVSEVLGVIDQVMGMINANQAQGEYRNKMEELARNQGLSPSATLAKNILRERSGIGLAGYDTMREDIQNQWPETLNDARQWLTGSQMAEFLSKGMATTNKQLRDLGILNEQEMGRNMDQYTNFLGGTMANLETKQQENQNMYELMGVNANLERRATNNEYMSSITGLLGSLGDTDWSKLIALLSREGSLTGRSPSKFVNITPGSSTTNPYYSGSSF